VHRDVVVIGASAGGLQALQQIVARLPADLAATVLVVVHLAPTVPSRLAEILTGTGPLPAAEAVDGETIRPGRVYTAAPDRHLLVGEQDVLRLSRGPRENRVRPAVDALFRAAARWCGPRVIGVVLSGSLDDGAAGLAAVTQRGGAALAQRPEDALFGGMPRAALAAVPEATAMPAAQLAGVITDLVRQPVASPAADPSEGLIWQTDTTEHGGSAAAQAGQSVGLGCPECGGGMNGVQTGNALHYVCHAGHSFSPRTLLAARDDGIEAALWTALSALQEKAMVLQELAARADRAGDRDAHCEHQAAARQARHAARLVRDQVIDGNRPDGPATPREMPVNPPEA
jgi:two-component system chemotaxis response regulator CheB